MTRVNLVNVEDLADQHLHAERREIKMVPAALRRSLKTRKVSDILRTVPSKYTLNTGHVTFFYTRLKFLTERYVLLTAELIRRGYNLEDSSDDFTQFTADIPSEFTKASWSPTKEDIAVNVERIVLRIRQRPDWYRHYGSVCSPAYFEALYNIA